MIAEQAVSALLGGGVGAAGVIALLLCFVWPYVRRKVENVATRHDIGQITEIVENIRKDQQLEIESHKADHQLKFVAAERRLQAHQEAYAMLMNLQDEFDLAYEADSIKEGSWSKVNASCEQWWRRNCLYLSEEAREARHNVIAHTNMMEEYLVSGAINARKQMRLLSNCEEHLRAALKTLQASIGLQPLKPLHQLKGKKPAPETTGEAAADV